MAVPGNPAAGVAATKNPTNMHTITLVFVLTMAGATHTAHADGELVLRGGYYKEKATRVTQPMLDAVFDAGESGTVRGHFLVDSITSASTASGAAGLAFNERRFELGGGYEHDFDRTRVGASLRFSSEPDYQSVFVGVRGQRDFAQRNTTIGVAVSLGSDNITNAGSQAGLMETIQGQLTSGLGSLSWQQVLSDVMLSTLTYDLTILDGFQENAYRTVVAGGVVEPERVPDRRLRHAIFGSVRRFVPPTKTTIMAGYRFYFDDWGIKAHTPEARIAQQLKEDVELHVRYRYHRQTAADFYKEVYDSNARDVEPYLTDDVKLSRFTTHSMGLKLEAKLSSLSIPGRTGDMRADIGVEYIVQDNRFGNAVTAQVGVTIPFHY